MAQQTEEKKELTKEWLLATDDSPIRHPEGRVLLDEPLHMQEADAEARMTVMGALKFFSQWSKAWERVGFDARPWKAETLDKFIMLMRKRHAELCEEGDAWKR